MMGTPSIIRQARRAQINFLSLFVAFSLMCVLPVGAQDNDGAEKPENYPRAIAFFHDLQFAVRKNNASAMERFVHYPLRVDIQGRGVLIRDRAAFLEKYPLIITPARRAAIISAHDADVWWRDLGYSIKFGVIWFDEFPARSSGSAGQFHLITVNPAEEEAR